MENLVPQSVKSMDGDGYRIAGGEGLRKLLLPWLIEHLDKGSFSGAQWADKKEGLFMLPWKHGKNKGFSEETDGEIFKPNIREIQCDIHKILG